MKKEQINNCKKCNTDNAKQSPESFADSHYCDPKAEGKIPDAQVVEEFVAILENGNVEARCAALALGYIGDARAVEPLIAALKENEDELLSKVFADALSILYHSNKLDENSKKRILDEGIIIIEENGQGA